jgi:hypothetical protein
MNHFKAEENTLGNYSHLQKGSCERFKTLDVTNEEKKIILRVCWSWGFWEAMCGVSKENDRVAGGVLKRIWWYANTCTIWSNRIFWFSIRSSCWQGSWNILNGINWPSAQQECEEEIHLGIRRNRTIYSLSAKKENVSHASKVIGNLYIWTNLLKYQYYKN